MSIELKQAAEKALFVLGSATSFMSRKARDQHESVVAELRAAIQQAEAQQPDNTSCKSVQKRRGAQRPATPEPVAWKYQPQDGLKHPAFTEHEAIAIAHGKAGSVVPLYDHPAPSVPDDVVRDAERYRWLRDNGVLGFSGAPSWRVSVSFDAMDAYAQTLDSNIDAAMLAAK